MYRILFICHGNICRSPMAEFVMKRIVSETGRVSEFEIDSAATSTEEAGNDMYPAAKRCLAAHGVPFSPRSARRITRSDYGHYDIIRCMDRDNLRGLRHIWGDGPLPKVSLLLDRDVDDPWYTGDFETAYRDIRRGCEALLRELSGPSDKS